MENLKEEGGYVYLMPIEYQSQCINGTVDKLVEDTRLDTLFCK